MSQGLRGFQKGNNFGKINKRRVLSLETKNKISKNKKGQPAWNKGLKGMHFSPITEFKKGHHPHKHKQGCKCFRCSGISWNKGKHIRLNTGRTHFKKGHKQNVGRDFSYMLGNKFALIHGRCREPYSLNWNETLKRAIRERDNYICQLCSQYGNITHHIDYDKKNCNPDNLITLCRKCHSRTNGNREYWQKYFTGI